MTGSDPFDPAVIARADQELASYDAKLSEIIAAWPEHEAAHEAAGVSRMHRVAELAYGLGSTFNCIDKACLLAVAVERLAHFELAKGQQP
jgi:hypothetical protein